MFTHRLVIVALAATAFSASVLAEAGASKAGAEAADFAASSPTAVKVMGGLLDTNEGSRPLRMREPLPKPESSRIELPVNPRTATSEVTGRVLVKFMDGLKVRAPRTPSAVLQTADGVAMTKATDALRSVGGGVVWQAIEKDPEWFAEVERRASDRSGETAIDLAGFVYVVPANSDLVACAKAFNDLDEVEFVVIEQLPIQAQVPGDVAVPGQFGAQTGCGQGPGGDCELNPGPVNCNKPGIPTANVDPIPIPFVDGRCSSYDIFYAGCSSLCEEPCSDGVNDRGCIRGCNSEPCCDLITEFIPNCETVVTGWHALCAMYASSLCGSTVYDSFGGIPGNPSSVPGGYKFDPCFAIRTAFFPQAPDDAIQSSYLSLLGLPPTVNFPFELVQVTAYSTDTVTPPPYGNSGLATAVAATGVNPAFPSSARFAMQDPSYERTTYSTVPTCFTIAPGRKGCNNTPCCVYVCLVEPSCCINSWDQACVRIASQINADNPCVQPLAGATTASVQPGPADFPMIQMANFPASGTTPNFRPSLVQTGYGPQARNLQTWSVAAPVAHTLEQLPIDPQVGLFAVAPPTNQTELSATRMFLNSGFRGGGLDLTGFEAAAGTLGIAANQTRGAGITIGVIDNTAFVNHEDLTGQVTIEPGFQPVLSPLSGLNPHHGTAALGIMVAKDNSIGITGVAPDSKAIFFPAVAGGGVGGRFFNAMASSLGMLKAGDVLCIPLDFPTVVSDPLTGFTQVLQGTVLQSFDVFALANTATQLGITVVVAAGNECSPVVAVPGNLPTPSASIVVGACWPGAQRSPFVYQGSLGYCRTQFSNFSQVGSFPNQVDVAGWGAYVTTCGYGDLWRGDNGGNPDEVNNLRTYTMQFGGTSAAAAMVAGCVARLQSTANALFGAPLLPQQVKTVVRSNIRPQCGTPGPPASGPNPCVGDLGYVPGDANFIRGFIDMGPFAVTALTTEIVGTLPEGVLDQTVQILVGRKISGSAASIRENDSSWLRIQASRPTSVLNPPFGPAINYPSSAVISDVLVTTTVNFTSMENLYGLFIAGAGQAVPNTFAYTIFYIYNVQLQRWAMIPSSLTFFAFPANVDADGDAIVTSGADFQTFYSTISNFVDFSQGFGKIRVRAVTTAPPASNTYQAWWDLISIQPNPPLQPPPPCWVAQAVYGMDDARWIIFRQWLDHHASPAFKQAYSKYGASAAKLISRSSTLKSLVRPMLDAAISSVRERDILEAQKRFAMTEAGHRLRAATKTIDTTPWAERFP